MNDKKLVFMSGDNTVKVFNSDEDANAFCNSMYENALQSARNEGIVTNDEDSEYYESDIALYAGQNANGECEVYDLESVINQLKATDYEEYSDFVEECKNGTVDLTGYISLSDIIESAEPENSSIY